tara:strand:- start:350 stop:652 length:303 start_codon:yes stop_codon:yes gene_type:complete
MNIESTSTTIKRLVNYRPNMGGASKYAFEIDGKEFHKISTYPGDARYFKLWFGHDGILQTTDYDNEERFLKAVCRAWDKAGSGDLYSQPHETPIASMVGK